MAYKKTTWAKGDVITSDKLNNLENGVETAQTVEGPAGKDGLSLTGLALKADATGKLTGGTATLSDGSTVEVTVTTATK